MNAIQQSPDKLEQRRREFMIYMEYFGNLLFNIYSIMPAGIIVYKNGNFEHHIPAEYQKRIDEILKQKNDFVKNSFPEFYKEN